MLALAKLFDTRTLPLRVITHKLRGHFSFSPSTTVKQAGWNPRFAHEVQYHWFLGTHVHDLLPTWQPGRVTMLDPYLEEPCSR